MKIALALGPDASAVSTFGTQCGVEHAVGTFGLGPIPDKPIDDEAQPFSRQSLARFKAQYEKNGYQLSVIESRPPMEKFDEAFHDDGKHDMAACVRAYRDTGYEGVARPDHFPQLTYEDFVDVHSMERLYAIGYMRGLIEAVYSE